MKISKKELINALDVIKPGLSNSEDTIDQSTSFAFIEDHIVTYNDSISISYPFETGITGAISAKELYNFLNKLSDSKDQIEIKMKKREIIINAGKEGKAGIKIDKEVKLPLDELSGKDKYKKIPSTLITGLNFCSFSTSKDNSKPLITCVHVKGDIVESTDNYRATRFIIDKKVTKEFLIPAKSVKFLNQFDAKSYAVSKSWVKFKSKEGAIFACRVFSQEYPDISGIMEVKGKKVKFPMIIKEAIERAAIFCEKEKSLSSPMIEVSLKKNIITIKGEGDIGWFKESTKTKYKGEEFSFNIASDFLLDMLKKNNTCELDKKSHRVKFTSDEWEHVVLLLIKD